MNTLIAAICLAVMVTVASGLGYVDRYSNRDLYSVGNVWGGSLGGGHLDSWGGSVRRGRRYRRAAVGYGPYDSYSGSLHNRRWGSRLGGIRGGIRGGRRGGWGGINSNWGIGSGY